jgi:hypothetical protein
VLVFRKQISAYLVSSAFYRFSIDSEDLGTVQFHLLMFSVPCSGYNLAPKPVISGRIFICNDKWQGKVYRCKIYLYAARDEEILEYLKGLNEKS